MNPTLQQKLKRNALIVAVLLLIPAALTLLNKDPNDGWRWGPGDFVFAFIIPFMASALYEVVAMRVQKRQHRLFLAGVITSAVCVLWIEVATDGISRNVLNILKTL